jgi:hypothetical protein
MTYTINQSMLGSDPNDTSFVVTASNNTSSSGLYWGLNGTSAVPGVPGQAGQVYTTTGTNTSWATLSADPNLQGNTLSVKGNADFEGEVTVKGKKLSEMFEKIEERLALLHPNPELEGKWDELRELSKRYKELEAEIIEKEKMWSILKK